MTSYMRSCRSCGRRISMRRMPHGKYVAFENNVVHDCKKPAPRTARNDQPKGGRSSTSDANTETGSAFGGFDEFVVPGTSADPPRAAVPQKKPPDYSSSGVIRYGRPGSGQGAQQSDSSSPSQRVHLRCPFCSNTMSLPVSRNGPVTCPNCRGRFTANTFDVVPVVWPIEAPAETQRAGPPRVEAPRAELPRAASPRVEPTRRQSLAWLWWLLGGGGVAALIWSQRKKR